MNKTLDNDKAMVKNIFIITQSPLLAIFQKI